MYLDIMVSSGYKNRNLMLDATFGDHFGYSVAVSSDTILVGAWQDDDRGTDSGSVYAFHFDGIHWVQTQKLVAFGWNCI